MGPFALDKLGHSLRDLLLLVLLDDLAAPRCYFLGVR